MIWQRTLASKSFFSIRIPSDLMLNIAAVADEKYRFSMISTCYMCPTVSRTDGVVLCVVFLRDCVGEALVDVPLCYSAFGRLKS